MKNPAAELLLEMLRIPYFTPDDIKQNIIKSPCLPVDAAHVLCQSFSTNEAHFLFQRRSFRAVRFQALYVELHMLCDFA